MKMTYNWLVAGMLAVAAATPVLSLQARASVQVQVRMTITDAMAYRILEDVVGTFEAQLQRSLSADILFSEYKAGDVTITYLGTEDGLSYFRVVHSDGGTGVSVIEEF